MIGGLWHDGVKRVAPVKQPVNVPLLYLNMRAWYLVPEIHFLAFLVVVVVTILSFLSVRIQMVPDGSEFSSAH